MVALGFGLAAIAFAAVLLLNSVVSTATHGGSMTIVVAKHDISFRNTITPDDVITKQVQSTDAPPGVFISTDTFQKGSYVAEVNIPSGGILTNNVVVSDASAVPGTQSAYLPIPAGFVAIQIRTSALSGVGGYIQVGDYVSVEDTLNLSLFGGKDAPVVKPIFFNVKIVKIGTATAPAQASGSGGSVTTGGAAGGVTDSYTVVMTKCDADYLQWFENNTSVSYLLESYHDYGSQPTGPDATCAVTETNGVGPAQVDTRFGFTTGNLAK
ncbi:MAG TPA: RcpC/CpaB family pilus assembly protein [Candidatus Dormibacteraeota bacterium]|jgi:Flp pilus assembly protein CpaB|nr:RcpC/CpaB family pilus assembly protein [Candidatus Dormibacteraeota bacterium]